MKNEEISSFLKLNKKIRELYSLYELLQQLTYRVHFLGIVIVIKCQSIGMSEHHYTPLQWKACDFFIVIFFWFNFNNIIFLQV